MEVKSLEPNPLKTAATIAREAGALLLSGFGHVHKVEFKGAINLVTHYDKESERHIVQRLASIYPNHNILSEELGKMDNQLNTDLEWIIDPLDGTSNYVHGYPFFAVSIALVSQGTVLAGVTFDPIRNEIFAAESGKGSTLNGKPIHVSKTPALASSMLATGFPYDIRSNQDNNLDHFSQMILRCQEIRRSGSAAIDLAWTSCGRLDGFWEIGLEPWDVAVGGLLVQESGGRVTDPKGSEHWLKFGNIVASNGSIHDAMLTVLVEGEKAPNPKGS